MAHCRRHNEVQPQVDGGRELDKGLQEKAGNCRSNAVYGHRDVAHAL